MNSDPSENFTGNLSAIAVGTMVQHYRIIEKIGAGGMGEVYLAEDSRLNRQVALKFLPAHLANNSEARARFEREARVISRLSHPHICTLFDIGRDRDTDFLVLEYLKGETLASRLERGALPIDELLLLGAQIADGLAKAHEAGVVHRDLKPGNLMLTASGVKLLDFGLSRPNEAREVVSASSDPATANLPLTTQGAFIGTVPYMSPEQITSGEIDQRTDIFALGTVLYEMATGQRLFGGTNSALIFSAIMQFSPDNLSRIGRELPRPLATIIRRCLQKNPADRYAHAGELLAELRRLRNWIRDEALPKLTSIIERIQGLDEGPEAWSAYELAREIERMADDDSQLEKFLPEFSRKINITSDPPGATVSIKYYGDPDGDWIPIGTTPLQEVRYPRGFTRLKIELAGHRPCTDLLWIIESAVFGATDNKNSLWHYQLVKPDDIPEEMELVPGGEFPLFMPGLDHLKTEPMSEFLLDRNPVTNRAYRKFVESGGYQREELWRHPFIDDGRTIEREEAFSRFTDAVGRPGPAGWEFGEFPPGEDDHPVTGISWYEAAAYAAWAGKELPTIFHWNRVAFTVASAQILPFCNFSGKSLLPVGSTQAMHRFGVYDLAGNVREWSRNECNRPGQRFILGGGWNDAEYAITDAYAQSPFDRSRTNGFRCMRVVTDEPNRTNLERVIELPFRDFLAEKPVSDEVFGFFLRQFHYDKTPLNARIESEEERPLGVLQKINFDAAYGGEQMIANLFLPLRPKPPLQTVVLFPGSLAIHVSSVGPTDFRRADFILKSGRALMLPIYKGTYQRGDELKSDYPEQSTFYKDHVIMWSKDLARSIDYLETRPDIDSSKLAYYGISWGGAMGAIMPAIEKRLKAVVLYVAGLNFQHALPEVDQINYVSRVTQPTLMLNGERDFFFPMETSQRPMFELLGTPPDQKKRLTYSLGHSVPRNELVKEVVAWLDKYLGPVA